MLNAYGGLTVAAGQAVSMGGNTVSDVGAGSLSATSTDAVNGSQLYATNQNVAANTTAIATNTGDISALQDNALQWNPALNGGTGAYDAGFGGSAQVITNVANGAVSATSTDAVNGSQLYALQQTATSGWNLSANGGTSVNVAPGGTIDVSAGSSGNVTVTQSGTSLTIDTSDTPDFTTVTTTGDINAGGMLNAYGGLTVAAGQAVSMGGNTVSDVGAGSLSATSTDAVNGSQLYATNQNVATNATNLQALGTAMASGLGGNSTYDPLTGILTTSLDYNGNTYNSVQGVFDQISGAVNGGGIMYFHANGSGTDSDASGTDSVAIGSGAVANNDGDVALGSGSVTAAANPTGSALINGTLYVFAGGSPTSVVSVGSVGNERQITNVAAGQLSAASTDAVNGSQLYATNQAVDALGNQVATNTGDISSLQSQINVINQNGAGMFQVSQDRNNSPMPTPTGTNSMGGGAGADASGDNSVALGNDATASGADSTAVGQGAQATGDNSVAIGTGSVADQDNTVSVGSKGNERRVTNVAAGVNPTDAVNVSQLQTAESGGVHYDTNTDGSVDYQSVTLDAGGAPAVVHNVATGTAANDAVNVGQLNAGIATAENWAQTYTDQRLDQLQGSMNHLGNRMEAGIASAIAAANLPQPYAPNQSALSVGLGTFRGETGIAVGLSKITENGRYILKANASSDSRGDFGAGVGAAVVW
jgi:autotransporter adhesin